MLLQEQSRDQSLLQKIRQQELHIQTYIVISTNLIPTHFGLIHHFVLDYSTHNML